MNCKPGDLAQVCRVTAKETEWMLGCVVRCASLDVRNGRPGWMLEHPLEEPDPGIWAWHWVADDCLRPIRDPGDDAQDETLQWLPVPSEGVPA